MASRYETKIDLSNRNSSHALIVDLVGYHKRVLDVGASTGYLAEVLVDHGCAVTGIEVDPEAARQAEAHCERVVVGDVEGLDLRAELGSERFEVIIFGDVLEHLKDPQRALERFEPLLARGGYVVASIPNIAHASVRLALLGGEFRYRSLGLLDNTHLRFFTRESVEQLFEAAGFLITGLRRTALGVFDTEIEVEREIVTGDLLRRVLEDPEATTYQFVLTAQPFGKGRTLDQADYERMIYELARKARKAEDLRHLLDVRNRQLAEKDRELARLSREVADLNGRLARLVQFGREDT